MEGQTVKHKVSELTGAMLDAAVAKADNEQPRKQLVSVSFSDDRPAEFRLVHKRYSTSWQYAGPLIEREKISVTYPEAEPAPGYQWHGNIARPDQSWNAAGPTALIAAMRAYCASVFGYEVDLP